MKYLQQLQHLAESTNMAEAQCDSPIAERRQGIPLCEQCSTQSKAGSPRDQQVEASGEQLRHQQELAQQHAQTEMQEQRADDLQRRLSQL